MKGVFFIVSRQELKRASKAQLSGNWGTCAIAMAVYIALIVVISIVGLPFEPLTTIIVAVIAFCFAAGFTCMFLKITKDEKVKIGDIFVNGRIYLRSFGFYVLESIAVYIYSFIITIIGAFLSFGVLFTSGAIEYLSSDSYWNRNYYFYWNNSSSYNTCSYVTSLYIVIICFSSYFLNL
ncbi:hypothetical protein [Clostridioides sp. ZZV15-6383]|uniref:hypothetical protein n=1 Tax=Clostridioides sp. ZZV15-6383 TaxID=2811498 RepID=UPI001D0FB515